MMKNLILHIQKAFINKSNKTVPLGRWTIETCNVRLNNKVDLANEDHCGPCGKYIIDKINITNTKANKI